MKKLIISLYGVVSFLTVFSQQGDEIPGLMKKLQSGTDTARINALIALSRIYVFKAKLDSASKYAESTLEESQKINYQKGIANAYNSLGNINLIKGNHTEAMQLYLKSLAIIEKLGEKKDLIPAYMNISTVYLRQKQYNECRPYLDIAWRLAVEIKDSVRLVGIQNNYATVLANTEKPDSALIYLRKSVDISNQIENRNDIDKNQLDHYKGNALLGMAQMLSRKGEGKTVILMLDSLWGKEVVSGTSNKIRVLRIIAENSLHLSDFNKAIEYANYALHMDSSYRNPLLLFDLYSTLADSYKGLKDYQKAYEASTLQLKSRDSIYSRNKISVISEMQAKYETEKKDSKITELKKSKKLQLIIIGLSVVAIFIVLAMLAFAQRAKKLQRKLFGQKEEIMTKQKEIEMSSMQKKMSELEQMALRAQMNPHFIFNSLNSVQHFVMKQDVEGVNKYLGAFAHLIRQTLNNSGKPLVSLDEEIKYLSTYLSLEKMKSNNGFDYVITVGENIDPSATFIPGMILQPFVENSIKHGVTHKEKNDGLVTINVSKNGRLVCQVEDNGIGRQKASEIKSAGVGAEYESKGMAITMNRIDTINKIYNTDISVYFEDIQDAENKPAGTLVKVEFPADMD